MEQRLVTDTTQLVAILPEELWRIVLSHVDDSRDFVNVCNASLFFRNLLMSQRKLFMFAHVLPILDSFQVKACRFGGGGGSNRWTVDMLSARRVCKAWSIAVDSLKQDAAQYTRIKREARKDLWTEVVLRNPQSVDQFLTHFESSHGNGNKSPFVSRAVVLTQDGGTGFTQPYLDQLEVNWSFRAGLNQFLSTYGSHVWFCKMLVPDRFSTRRAYYIQIAQWLQLMPNLKLLKWEYIRPVRNYDDDQVENHVPSEYELIEIRKEMELRPLPKFKDLEYFGAKSLPCVIFNEMLSRNSHLRKLKVKQLLNKELPAFQICSLKEASFQIDSLKDFKTLQNADMQKLDKLFLYFGRKCEYIPLNEIFAAITQWTSNKLTCLVVHSPVPKTRKQRVQHDANMLTFYTSHYGGIQQLELK